MRMPPLDVALYLAFWPAVIGWMLWCKRRGRVWLRRWRAEMRERVREAGRGELGAGKGRGRGNIYGRILCQCLM